ncbi:MAG: hypothetical protein ACRDH9_07585 [Actinomycetota bacterium]
MPGRPRLLPLFSALLILSAVPLTAAADEPAEEAEQRDFTLALGEKVFWTGPGSGMQDCGTACWAYRLNVTEPGYRLRVGFERPLLGDVWRVDLLYPSGSTAGSFSPGTDLYSAEYMIFGAEVGTYTLRVTAQDVTDLRFRMRATVEADNGGLVSEHVLTPPDLQPLPPWDFSFKMPVTNGIVGGESIGATVPGGRPSCHPEEFVEKDVTRCLRMSFGVLNVGQGPLELQVGPGQEYEDRPLIQHVRYADSGFVSRSAGNAYYHTTHLHYHHDKAVGLELLRVVDPETGALVAAAEPHLKGFAHRDELLRKWETFYPVWGKQGFGLLPGWGDYYEWDRPGNYIDFGENGDGIYVVRITADPEGFILETDTTDNVAYSVIWVKGDTIDHLESGIGSDPWDPCRIPLALGPEWVDSFEAPEPRPEECADEATSTV